MQIGLFSIGMRQGCKLFKVVPPHLTLVAWICVCIIIGSLDRVIDALRQVDWFHIKFKSIVGWLFFARFLSMSIAWPSIYLPSSQPIIMETLTDKAKSTSSFKSVSIPPPLGKDGPGQDWGRQLENRAPVWGRHGCLLQKWQWNTTMQNPNCTSQQSVGAILHC